MGPQGTEHGYSGRCTLSLDRVCGGWWFLRVLENSVTQELGVVWAWHGSAGHMGLTVFRVCYSGRVWENDCQCWWEIGEIEGLSD